MKLDIGCGSNPAPGHLAIDAYRESDHHHSPTEPDVLGDANALPIADAAVSRVRIRHVLEHLERPLRALDEAHRVLESGGELYLEVPNPTAREQMGVGPERRDHHSEHLYSWSAGSLERLCRHVGFDAIEYHPDHADSQPRGHAVVAVKP